VVDRFEALDSAAFPNVRAMVPLVNSLSPDEQFERGLAWILNGLAGELARARAGRKASAAG
jgi:hypothetical protein